MTCSAAIIRRYKTREQVRGYLASRGFHRTLEGWRNGRWIGHVNRDDGGFWVEVSLPTAYGSSFEREHLMTEQDIPDSHDDDAAPFRGSQAPVVRFETLVPFTAPVGLLDGGVNLDLPRCQESWPEEALLDTHGRCKSRHNRTGTSVTEFRRELAQIWRLMLALRIDEAVRMIEQVEPRFDDVPPANARRLRAATQLLRAVGFAYQDDSLTVLPIAVSLLEKGGTTYDNQAALWLRRRHWLFRVVIAFRWSLPDLASLGAISRTPDCWE